MTPKHNHPTGLRGWTELASDVNWEDYHGMWARKVNGVWWVLVFTNMWDAAGEDSGLPQYECAVKRLALDDVGQPDIAVALRSCGLTMTPDGLSDDRGDIIDPLWVELAAAEACIGYGLGAPMGEFTSDTRPRSVRAQARRAAEALWADEAACAAALGRPVNAIGSTAEEYGRGDVMAALYDGRNPGPAKQLMLKLCGLSAGAADESPEE